MKFEMPKIVRRLPVEEYAPEVAKQVTIEVWVNPPRGKVTEQYSRMLETAELARNLVNAPEEAQAEIAENLQRLGEETEAWLAEVWSQGLEAWTAADVRGLADGLLDTDPELFTFLLKRSFQMILEHRGAVKKK